MKDSNLKEREGGSCPGCGKRFVFDPQKGDPFTDMGFLSALNRVSGTGTVKFNEANLYYEFKRTKRTAAGVVVVACLAGAFALFSLIAGVPAAAGASVIGGGLLIAIINSTRRPYASLSANTVLAAASRWRQVNGELPGLIVQKKLPAGASGQLQAELDAYSFDRAVITDTAQTAELLLANDFHFENNCAVLSVDGSPAHAFEPVRRMLRKNPRLEVFALHDCTPEGCTLAFRLKHDPAWFKEFGKVHDVALRPAQAKSKSLKGLREPASGQFDHHASITADEGQWLQSWNLKLAAIRPEQLIKRLFKSMQAPSASTDDGSITTWSTDASASDGGADSFG